MTESCGGGPVHAGSKGLPGLSAGPREDPSTHSPFPARPAHAILYGGCTGGVGCRLLTHEPHTLALCAQLLGDRVGSAGQPSLQGP